MKLALTSLGGAGRRMRRDPERERRKMRGELCRAATKNTARVHPHVQHDCDVRDDIAQKPDRNTQDCANCKLFRKTHVGKEV